MDGSRSPISGTTPDEILGPQCPDCRWRYEHSGHKPALNGQPACPQWTPKIVTDDAQPEPETP